MPRALAVPRKPLPCLPSPRDRKAFAFLPASSAREDTRAHSGRLCLRFRHGPANDRLPDAGRLRRRLRPGRRCLRRPADNGCLPLAPVLRRCRTVQPGASRVAEVGTCSVPRSLFAQFAFAIRAQVGTDRAPHQVQQRDQCDGRGHLVGVVDRADREE